MSTTGKEWTINDIKASCRAAGSHWFDPGTMRFFSCRVGQTVYQGPGGIYFVTSECDGRSPRRYTVRQFLPPDAIETVGDFNALPRATAIRRAKELAGEGAARVSEAYQPVSDLQQFADDLAAHGCTPTIDGCRDIIRLSRRHHRLMEDYCNGLDVFDEENEPLRPLATVRAAAEAAAARMGAGVMFSGDPRGATLKLIMPDGYTDDWGREGLVVPTQERER